MKNHFVSVANKHCLLRWMKVAISRPEYINLELLELMKERDDAFKTARTQQTDASWNHARILRSRVQSGIYNARKSYVAKQITNSHGDGRKFWNTIKKEFFKEGSKKLREFLMLMVKLCCLVNPLLIELTHIFVK